MSKTEGGEGGAEEDEEEKGDKEGGSWRERERERERKQRQTYRCIYEIWCDAIVEPTVDDDLDCLISKLKTKQNTN